MDSSSSSKVTGKQRRNTEIEYHDPSGIFPLVSPSIASRLPLRNLNWQSPSRPLRQIKSLHLDFVPDDFTSNSLRPPTAQAESDGANSFDIVRSGAETRRRDGKERRHQIPGLQTSPYLKIYVLRCDDKDAYKSTERGKVRQWIRDNSVPSTSKKNTNQNENHSASEYLILHVVIPDTIAASEPRWRESQREPDELRERKQGAKWPGKSTRTVFDKLRADFNDSSKVDRVAQLRLNKDSVPPDLLPTPAQAVTYDETADEQSKTWHDLLTKLKSLILVPFDKRVRQYEQDIAEQESRRSLPGFNFCTFFIHKEGLARALEAIGLVGDALVIYDELSLGLESVLRDMASGQAEGTATTFASYTDDIRERILSPGKAKTNGTTHEKGHHREDSESVDPAEIDYRERIVRSNISVFDFHCYLFSRRKALILRLANAVTARNQLGAHTKEGGEDLVLISEVCWRASNFLHNTARVLRQDLLAAKTAGKAEFSSADVDALVCSWLYTVAGQILDQTATSALNPQADHARQQSLKSPPNGAITSPRRSDFSDLGSATAYPQRTSSMPARKSRVSELQTVRASIHSASEETLVSPPSSAGTDGTKPAAALPGLPELVTYRAELVMMRRKMLEQVAAQRGWLAGWASLRARRSRLEDVDLNGDVDSNETVEGQAPSTLLTPALTSSLLSREVFHEAYDRLSDQAMRYYVQATQSKSAEAIVGDLAILKYQQSDYEFAAQYFEHVLPTYREEGWAIMEVEALQVLKVCLRELGRRSEEVGIGLDLVQKRVEAGRRGGVSAHDFDQEGLMSDVVTLSAKLEKEVVVPAANFFGDLVVERDVLHVDEHDGFALNLHLKHFLDEDLVVDEVIVRLVHVDDPNQELCLVSGASPVLKRGRNNIRLESSVTAFGPYFVDTVILKAENIYFNHEFQPSIEPSKTAATDDSSMSKLQTERPWIFVYPAQRAFSAEISLGQDVHIDKPRHLEIKLGSGWNDIATLDLRLKPASAGLRLHLADALTEGIQRREGVEIKPGVLALGDFASGGDATVKIPYSLDHPSAREIAVNLSAHYSGGERSFTFLTTARFPTELPLDVDVNDIFHDDALFSNFTIRVTSKAPLCVSSAELRASKVYNVEAPPIGAMGTMTVFERQSAKLVYKITRKSRETGERVGKKEAALALDVRYVVMDDFVSRAAQASFAKALDESTFASLRRFLCPLVATRVKQLLSSSDVEMATLLGEATVPAYDAMGWAEIVKTLPTAVQPELEAWLRKWHEENTSLALDLENVPDEQQRSITISVEVPTVDFVHKATVSLLDPLHVGDGVDGQVTVALGEPVTAELTITSTTDWSKDSIFDSPKILDSSEQEQPFIYDIHADPETWLISGPRRAHFVASNPSQAVFRVTLVPLKLGSFALPLVDVQPALQSTNSGDGSGSKGEAEIRCETHCASAGETVRVIRDQRRSRVFVPEEEGEGHGVRRPSTSSRPETAGTVREAG